MHVILGGTFDPLHAGHEHLLEHTIRLAGDDGSITIGLVSDAFSQSKRGRSIAPYAKREAGLREWFRQRGLDERVAVNPLDDPYGPSISGDYDAMVASVETAPTAYQVNEARRQRNLRPLRIEIVPYVLGEDLLPVSATRIALGAIDQAGRRSTPLSVALGSKNPVKMRAAGNALRRFITKPRLEVVPFEVHSGVPEQPHGMQAAEGAHRRALAALEAGRSQGAEYGIGIEAGILTDPYSGVLFDVQHCVVVDITGFLTHGHGSGFSYPPMITEQVLREGRTVSQAFEPLTHDPRIGQYEGAVGWLTEGVLDRTRLSEQAVEAAFVPRLKRGLYEPHTVVP